MATKMEIQVRFENYPRARAVQTKNRDGSKIAIEFGETRNGGAESVDRAFVDNHVI